MLRNLGQKIFEIPIRIQIVCLGGFCNAVTYSTCPGSGNGVYQVPVAFPDHETPDGLLGGVVVQRNISVFQEPAQVLLLVNTVGDSLTGLALAGTFPS